jgi:glycosyltransferase involved in cell wall biosynthesis
MLIARVIARLELGGTQLGALRLTEALRGRGIESRLLAGQASRECLALYGESGISVELWSREGRHAVRVQPGVASWLRPRLEGVDLVHGHMFEAWWAVTEAVADGVPVGASEHNALRWPAEPRLVEMRRALRRVDAFFAHGPTTRTAVRRLGLPASRLHAGRCAIEPAAPLGHALGSDHLFGHAPRPRVLLAGRLHPEKGPDLLLDAPSRLSRPPACFMLGAGPQEAELRRRARELGIADLVRFAGWQQRVGPWPAPTSSSCPPATRHGRRPP